MRKTIAFSLLAFTASVNAQIKVFTGGSVTIGATSAPYGVTHQVVGDKMVFSATDASITSAPLILGQNSVSSSPAFTFWGDNYTGIAHPAYQVLGITIGNSEKFRFNNNGQILNNNSTSSASNPDYSWNNNSNTGIFHPTTNAIGFSTSGNEKMRLDANGNLGIGTVGPSEKLHVVGNSRLHGNVRFENWTSVFLDWTGPYSSAVISPENDWYLQLGTSTKYLGDAYITHILTRNSITFTSDQSVKQNINYNLSSVSSKLKQLKPASYNFKSNLSPGAPAAIKSAMSANIEYGLIAQDLLQVFPELVEKDNNTNLYGVKYIEFIPLLISAFNEQQLIIDSLKQQMNICCLRETSGNTSGRLGNTSFNNSPNEDSQSYIKQNKPNPFSNETVIDYNIIDTGSANILIFDMSGKLLKTISIKIPGKGSITINANDFSAGMYYYSLVVNDKEIDTKRMILTDK